MTATLLSRIVPLLHKAIPIGLATKGLAKISPKLGSFIQNSIAAGYSTDMVLDYLRKRTSDDYHNEEGRTLRPDEVTSKQNYNPKDNKKALSTAIGLGAGLTGLMGGGREEQIQNQEQEQPQQAPPQEQPQMLQGGQQIPSQGTFQSQHQPKTREQALQQFRKMQQGGARQPQQSQQSQQQKPQNNTDAAILAALEKILQM